MDSTLLGVIIGSGMTFAGGFLNQLLSTYKEKKQWDRQRTSAKEDKREEIIQKEKEYLRELYYKCLLSLSVYISKENENAKEEKKVDLSEYRKEAHHWLSLLSLRWRDTKLEELVDNFLDDYDSDTLRKYVLELAKKEQSFFHSNSEVSDDNSIETETSQQSNDNKTITIGIDNDFRKQHIIETGEELPKSYQFECKLTELKPIHREKLVDIYFKNQWTIPIESQLNVPMCVQTGTSVSNNEQKKIMNIRYELWKAKLNPLKMNSSEILDCWVKDYDEYNKVAQEKLNT